MFCVSYYVSGRLQTKTACTKASALCDPGSLNHGVHARADPHSASGSQRVDVPKHFSVTSRLADVVSDEIPRGDAEHLGTTSMNQIGLDPRLQWRCLEVLRRLRCPDSCRLIDQERTTRRIVDTKNQPRGGYDEDVEMFGV